MVVFRSFIRPFHIARVRDGPFMSRPHEEGVFFQGAGKPGLCRCDVSLAALVELGLFYCYIQGVGPRIDMDDVAIADQAYGAAGRRFRDRKSTRPNSSHSCASRMPFYA